MKKISKIISALLIVCVVIFTFTACSETNPPEESAFTLQMDFSQTTVKSGEKVSYKVMLKNMTDESYTLSHSEPLIELYVIGEGEKEKTTVSSEKLDTSFNESDIAPNGQIDKIIEFTAKETGEYILKAHCTFKIDGKDYDKSYTYKCGDVKISVE